MRWVLGILGWIGTRNVHIREHSQGFPEHDHKAVQWRRSLILIMNPMDWLKAHLRSLWNPTSANLFEKRRSSVVTTRVLAGRTAT
jgi:hypothetical protein